ncbi:MAG: hypothetical protein QNJ41_08050 [Xenococcaceae cyanobacterium MO_188.B32]|nr:hypothetical protein [Xenococcaceae cyanobacterium MO_188.B32]
MARDEARPDSDVDFLVEFSLDRGKSVRSVSGQALSRRFIDLLGLS